MFGPTQLFIILLMQTSQRILSLAEYPFAELQNIITNLKKSKVDVIDFGVGDPVDPTPEFIRQATKKAIDEYASSGYPSYTGSEKFRQAVANWFAKRFNVQLNSDTEITSSIGSKEAIFNFPLAFIDAGDLVISPTPGYPPYSRGTSFAGGENFFVPLTPENNFLIDFEKIPAAIASRAKILWLNYPNSPTGAIAPDQFYERAIEFCQKNNIILASDLAYSEIYFHEKPKSILEFTRKNVIEFHSLSKRSRMTGYRIGFVVGDEKIVKNFKKVKTNLDSGTPNFIQSAAIAALADEDHVIAACEEYLEKRNILISALKKIGLECCESAATFYIWQRVPKNETGESFAKKLLQPKIAIAATPGAWISDESFDQQNPGKDFVRFALVPTVEQVKEAAKRISILSSLAN
jgi:LL-diaminopimelate aminotransferase